MSGTLMPRTLLAAMAALLALAASPVLARVEKIVVHSTAIEGNLEGNSADRTVYVVLPDGYDAQRRQRWPVLYFLHGFTSTADEYMGYVEPGKALATLPRGQQFIIVLPDSNTRRGGSFYASSPTVGDFETFVARDLVGWIDAHYRTLARREARGLAGHSMGGYGTLRVGMKHPEVFSSLFAMSACCLSPSAARPEDARYETIDPDKVTAREFMDLAYFATAAAYSPDPQAPPHYFDLVTRDGKPVPMIEARWAANAPSAMIAQYAPALKGMTAVAMDVGDKDFLLSDNVLMHGELQRFGVPHEYTLYEGDHGNRVHDRFRDFVLPFFARHLARGGK